jgi:hypothetical protein
MSNAGRRNRARLMPKINFTAFYPSRPFWAATGINFGVPRIEGWFHDQMVEEVYSTGNDNFALKVCRDGRILVRIPSLESVEALPTYPPIEDIVRRWGEYLDFLNTFYLLLDSATLEVEHLSYFNLHEITNRDAFRVTYEGGKVTGEDIATESIASVYQMGRYSGSYRTDLPIEFDTRISMRRVISLAALSHAGTSFQQVIAAPGCEKPLAAFAKSLAEYKVGNYETCIVLAWFITEAAISSIWRSHLERQNLELANGRKRLNRERKDFLAGRDFSTSIVSNMLELAGVLENEFFEEIDTVRGYRNKIVHAQKFTPGSSEAQLSMKIAQAMIERLWSIRFTPNISYSVSGL